MTSRHPVASVLDVVLVLGVFMKLVGDTLAVAVLHAWRRPSGVPVVGSLVVAGGPVVAYGESERVLWLYAVLGVFVVHVVVRPAVMLAVETSVGYGVLGVVLVGNVLAGYVFAGVYLADWLKQLDLVSSP